MKSHAAVLRENAVTYQQPTLLEMAAHGIEVVPDPLYAPTPKPNPVKVERERLNAAALRVLAYLEQHGEATNVELCRPEVGGMRAVGRIHELRRAGHAIEKKHLHGGIWAYRIVLD